MVKLDCKVTPAGCACQEGNTIGCISSNGGLDAGFELELGRVFHTDSRRSVKRRNEFEVDADEKQSETGGWRLMDCDKVEISVDGCGRRISGKVAKVARWRSFKGTYVGTAHSCQFATLKH
jgi:hypothetical protein